MFFFYNFDQPASWVMGQIDVRDERVVFDVEVESSGMALIGFDNGLVGLLTTGDVAGEGPRNRLLGTEGVIEVGGRDKPPVRLLSAEKSFWQVPDLNGIVPEGGETVLSVFDLIDSLRDDREPELSGRKALMATELIFATYESARRRARIDLPLNVDDSALLSMLEEGIIGPAVAEGK